MKPISWMRVQPNIFHSIVIFVPNIWEGGLKLQGHFLLIMVLNYGTCVQSNVFHSILVFVPNIWGGRIQNTEIQMLSLRPSGSQYSLAVRFTAKNGGYPGDGKLDHERHKNGQIGATICPGPRETCQNFFVGGIFLEVITQIY